MTVNLHHFRYILINHPHSTNTKWKNRRWVWLLVACVWIISTVCNVPRFFVFNVDSKQCSFVKSSYAQMTFYLVLSWLYFVVIALGSSIVLIVLNTLLIIGLRRISNRRVSMVSRRRVNGLQRDDLRLTWMLVVLVFVFLVGEIPSACVSRLLVVDLLGKGNETVLSTASYRLASLVAYTLVVSQHSLNFIVYCLMNKKFEAALRSLVCVDVKNWLTLSSTRRRRPGNTAAITTTQQLETAADEDGEESSGNDRMQMVTTKHQHYQQNNGRHCTDCSSSNKRAAGIERQDSLCTDYVTKMTSCEQSTAFININENDEMLTAAAVDDDKITRMVDVIIEN